MNELVVVTGASRGIGLAIARRFQERGAQVWNLARTASGVDGVVDIQVDLSVPGFEERLPDSLVREALASTRTVLIHNASLMASDTVESVDAAGLRRMFEVAVHAPAALNRTLLPKLPRGSAVLYLGSVLSEQAVPGSFSYVVAKHAVVGMMKATCQDLFGRGIHTVCVCPGLTDTEMLKEHVGNDAARLAVMRAMTGVGRLIEPDEIARIVELASDNPIMDGAVLHANFGQRNS